MYKYLLNRYMRIETIRRQSMLSLLFQIILTIVGFFITIYFARTVGAEVLGAYFLFLSYLGIINMMSSASIEGAAVKRISEGEESDSYFTAFVVLRSLLFVSVIILLIIFKDYFQDLNNSGLFVWMLILLIFYLFNGIVSSGTIGSGKIGVSLLGTFIQTIFQDIFQVVAIYLGYKTGGLVFGFAIGVIVSMLLQFRFFNLHFVRFGKKHIKSLLSFSFWSVITLGGSMIFIYSDTIMIGYFMKNSDVGTYRIIFQFTSIILFIMYALGSSLYVKISLWDKNNEKEFIEKSFSKALTYSLILALPIFVGGIILGDKLLFFLYGTEFVNYPTLVILYTVQIIFIFNYMLKLYLTAMNKLKEVFKITLITALLNIILNFIFIPIVGISGAAIATLITLLISTIMSNRIFKNNITQKLEYSSIFNIVKASLIIGAVVIVYRSFISITNIWLLIFPIIMCGILYGILIFKFDKNIYNESKNIVMNV